MTMRLVALLFCCLLFLSATKERPLKLGLFYVPLYLESESKGVFIRIIDEVIKMQKLEIEKNIYPGKRLIQKFQENEIDGFFPSVRDFRGIGVLETIPFYYKKDFFFYHSSNKPEFLNRHTQKKIKLCLTRGYPYRSDLLSDASYQINYAESDASCFKMLNAKRVDAHVCELVTGIVTLERQGLTDIKIHPKELSSFPVSVAFRNDSRGQKYVEKFSEGLKKLIDSGVLKNEYFSFTKDMAKKYGIDFDPLSR